MLATPATVPPEDEGWAFEIKWDGVREHSPTARAARSASRRGAVRTRATATPSWRGCPTRSAERAAILDGEVVAFDAEGRPSFQTLQKRMGLSRPETIRRRSQEVPVTFVAFDLLHLDSESLLSEPYERRRELLAELDLEGDCWRAPAHRIGDGPAFLEAARSQGLEGIVCKRLGTPYRPGRRSADWLKIRARLGQELVIGGYMPGEGGRTGSVGSLLSATGTARPMRRCRPGAHRSSFTPGASVPASPNEMLKRLRALLEPLRIDEMAFELGEDPRLKYKGRASPGRRAGLGRAAPRLRGRVHGVDVRGHAPPAIVQGPPRRQGLSRGRAGDLGAFLNVHSFVSGLEHLNQVADSNGVASEAGSDTLSATVLAARHRRGAPRIYRRDGRASWLSTHRK